MPEEILSDHPERLRAVMVTNSNPLRSYADTSAYEEAFKRLDLLVTSDIALTETAVLSHYVLPSRTAYEAWDGTFFALTFPDIFFQMKQPIVEPEPETREPGEIHLLLADRLGLIPPVPESLYKAAKLGRTEYVRALFDYISKEPNALKMMPFILGKTLGRVMGSVHLAALWGMLQAAPKSFHENAARLGYKPGPGLAGELFKKIIDHPEGIWIGRVDPENNLGRLQTEDGRICTHIPELLDTIRGLDAEGEEKSLQLDPAFPLILMAGRHVSVNANTNMRNPAWNEGKRACTLTMHPADAVAFKLQDGQHCP